MKVCAVLNTESGSLKKLDDISEFCRHLETSFNSEGHDIEVRTVTGKDLLNVMENVAGNNDYDTIVACGGDGTVSLTASLCHQHDKTCGVLPAGTMNLYARTLGIPLDIHRAAEAIAAAEIKACDIATANGRAFVHQFSLGLQPEIIRVRDQIKHTNSTGKMLSGLKATMTVLSDEPQTYSVRFDGDSEEPFQEVSVMTVSNNLYGQDQLPYADKPDGGTLGLYWAPPLGRLDAVGLITDILSGSWNHNQHLVERAIDEIVLTFEDPGPNENASLDGELVELEETMHFKTHKGALKVLVPEQVSLVEQWLS